MSGCQGCDLPCTSESLNRRKETPLRATLFTGVSVLMVIGWIGVLTVVFEVAGDRGIAAAPTLDAFLRTLL